MRSGWKETLCRAAARLSRLIETTRCSRSEAIRFTEPEDLLSFARPKDIVRAPVAIDELLTSVVQRFIDSGEADGHPVRVEVAAEELWADAGRLRQVVLNLLRNATQASPQGEPVDVTGAGDSTGRGYVFRVADRGPGLKEPDKSRIFEPFFSKHDGGYGLGLAVCHGIVTAHGGTIEVGDRAPRGAVFKVTLPLDPTRSEELPS